MSETHFFPSTVASFPDSNFTISALDRLEAMSGISVYKHLASQLPTMVSTFLTDTRDMYQEWISHVHPTWQTLLGVLDHPLAKAIEDFLKPKTQMTSPVQLLLLFTNGCCLPMLLFTSGCCLPMLLFTNGCIYLCCCLPMLLFTSSYGITLHNPIFSSSSCGKEKKRNSKSNQKVGSLCQEHIRTGGSRACNSNRRW